MHTIIINTLSNRILRVRRSKHIACYRTGRLLGLAKRKQGSGNVTQETPDKRRINYNLCPTVSKDVTDCVGVYYPRQTITLYLPTSAVMIDDTNSTRPGFFAPDSIYNFLNNSKINSICLRTDIFFNILRSTLPL